MSAERRPAAFGPWFPLLDRWLSWCNEQGVTPLAAALGFVLTQPGISRVIVGVDSTDQLQDILAAARLGRKQPPADLFSEDAGLIDPSTWKLP
jgi:aryl-alcohol dehydrogenase-like predicted oxidoreductase